MLTAKDIREAKFSRSMGGYKKEEVDDFLDLCAETVEELSKENGENTRKMQVLAETIMDYRNQEDSIRAALISAQRLSESVVADAHKKAEEIIAEAEAEASKMREKALADTAAEQGELVRVKQEVADFKAKLLSIYREHLTLIGVLEGETKSQAAPEEKSAPAVEEPATATEAAPVVEAVVEEAPLFTTPSREIPDLSAFVLEDEE